MRNVRHAYEKALEIATQIMSAQLQGSGIGNSIDAQSKGEYFLKLVETINAGIEKIPD